MKGFHSVSREGILRLRMIHQLLYAKHDENFHPTVIFFMSIVSHLPPAIVN